MPMRIVTWNVNSLQRLLNHPIQHIFKGSSKTNASSSSDSTNANPPLNHPTNAAHSHSTSISPPPAPTPTPLPSSLSSTWLASSVSSRLRLLLDSLDADLICFQEVKMSRHKLSEEMAIVEGYDSFFSCSKKRQGYSGVVTFCRKQRTSAAEGNTNANATGSRTCPLRAEEGFTGTLPPPTTAAIPSSAASLSSLSSSTGSTSSPTTSSPSPSSATSSSFSASPTSVGALSSLWCAMDPSVLRELDMEGRVVMTDHGQFVLINAYFPNAPLSDVNRCRFKQLFNRAIQIRCESLVRSGRHVILVGDVNAARDRIDHCDWQSRPSDPDTAWDTAEATAPDADPEQCFEAHPSRRWLHQFLVEGGGMFVDVTRRFHPTRKKMFTVWNQKIGARPTNYGTRIDYVLADQALFDSGFFLDSQIRPDIHCSDHCPVQADINTDSLCDDATRQPPPLCSKWMPEFSGAQQSIQAFFGKGARNLAAAAAPAATKTSASDASAPPQPRNALQPSISSTLSSASASTTSIAASSSSSSFSRLKRPWSMPSIGSTTSSSSSGSKRSRLNSSASTSCDATSRSIHAFFNTANAPNATTKSNSLPNHANHLNNHDRKAKDDQPSTIVLDDDIQCNAQSTTNATLGSPAQHSASNVVTASSSHDAPTHSFSPSASSSSSPGAVFSDSPHLASPSSATCTASAAWKGLLGTKPPQVLCPGHKLPARFLTVKKPGVNYGRPFYMCSLPPPERCNFMLWAAQVKTSKATNSKGMQQT